MKTLAVGVVAALSVDAATNARATNPGNAIVGADCITLHGRVARPAGPASSLQPVPARTRRQLRRLRRQPLSHGLEPNPSLWKMVARMHGQTDAGAPRKSLDGAIKSSSDHFDRDNAELSYIAGK